MDIFILGTSHHQASVEIREKLQGPGSLEPEDLHRLQTVGILEEGLLVSTCNRLEAVCVAKSAAEAKARLLERLAAAAGPLAADLGALFHFYLNGEAVGYLFRVAAGLDSQVLGEAQILGQVKEAYRAAMAHRSAGPIVGKLFHKCFQVAKRIRSETRVSAGKVSVASAAIASAMKSLGDPPDLSQSAALVVGAGEMAALLVAHLKSHGVGKLIIVSRTLSRAQELGSRHGCEVRTLPQLGEALGEADLIFTAAGGGERVLLANEIAPILVKRAGAPWRVFDLGVPRNVESSVGALPNVTLMDMDDFRDAVAENQDARRREASKGEAIVAEEVLKFQEWLSALETRPTVKDLTQKCEEARRVELRRTLAHHHFDDEEIAAIDAMTKALVRRLLHHPLMFTKSCHRHWRAEFNLGMVRRIFGLD
ncbi:MAG: glutamyl-tRNA reductase [Deltaproteobacteria bacterium]|jgi:glutamyl-tRNA reductase|nr:glutamyl-tRNA reductase [Deltaproteobacteria bacterium]